MNTPFVLWVSGQYSKVFFEENRAYLKLFKLHLFVLLEQCNLIKGPITKQ